MKARAERMACMAADVVKMTLSTTLVHLDYVIEAMDKTHNAHELAQNLTYCALMSAAINIKQTLKDFDAWISGQNHK